MLPQLTGFYMRAKLACSGLIKSRSVLINTTCRKKLRQLLGDDRPCQKSRFETPIERDQLSEGGEGGDRFKATAYCAVTVIVS